MQTAQTPNKQPPGSNASKATQAMPLTRQTGEKHEADAAFPKMPGSPDDTFIGRDGISVFMMVAFRNSRTETMTSHSAQGQRL